MARKCLAALGAFLAVMSTAGSNCHHNNTITGPGNPTGAPTATLTPIRMTSTPTPTPGGPTNTPAPPTATITPIPLTPTSTFTPTSPTSSPTRTATPTPTPIPSTATPPPPTATPAAGAPTITGYESAPPAHPGDVFDIVGTNVGSCSSMWFLKTSGGTTFSLICQFGSDIDAQLQIPLTVPKGTYTICVKRMDGQQACSSFTVTLS
ncbi:MAG TPA: hypothetical protein VF376_12285 [Thermoanaerobaculia bacterium]